MEDLKYIIAATVCFIGLLSLSYGFTFGIYTAISYLWFNAVLIILVYGFVVNPDVFPKETFRIENVHRNHMLQFFVHVITGFFLYSLYVHGYVFHACALSFMLALSFTSNVFTFLASLKETKE